jgi:biphenyl 2,3-dioxygenase beta subunit
MSPEQAMVLQHEVEQFLYREAALLDDRRFADWLALIADDIHYWMPIRRTVTVENLKLEYASADGMAYFDDDKSDLRMRVEKLQ